jgi:5-methyltetrahydrofolate--homocysteine methyltransferase
MLIIGERINTSRTEINEAVEKRDPDAVQRDVKAQTEAGAQVIDVNAGSRSGSELEDLIWLIDVIQEAAGVRLSIDSPSPDCLVEAMGRVRGLPMLNSTTAEKDRFERMARVVEKRECEVVALCLDDRGLPKAVEQILENAYRLVSGLESLGVRRERIYLDPLVQAVSTDPVAATRTLEAIARIKKEFPAVNTVCGLSNVSYALPKRYVLNRAFLTLAMEAGLSAVILDPLDKGLMGALMATAVLLGKDEYCLDYIGAFREGRF